MNVPKLKSKIILNNKEGEIEENTDNIKKNLTLNYPSNCNNGEYLFNDTQQTLTNKTLKLYQGFNICDCITSGSIFLNKYLGDKFVQLNSLACYPCFVLPRDMTLKYISYVCVDPLVPMTVITGRCRLELIQVDANLPPTDTNANVINTAFDFSFGVGTIHFGVNEVNLNFNKGDKIAFRRFYDLPFLTSSENTGTLNWAINLIFI